jgi:hypothetical protein
VLAFINSQSDLILSAKLDTIFEKLGSLTFRGRLEVKSLLSEGKRLRAQTPDSFCR